jgi:FAD/FMN-containing dehydrogenase
MVQTQNSTTANNPITGCFHSTFNTLKHTMKIGLKPDEQFYKDKSKLLGLLLRNTESLVTVRNEHLADVVKEADKAIQKYSDKNSKPVLTEIVLRCFKQYYGREWMMMSHKLLNLQGIKEITKAPEWFQTEVQALHEKQKQASKVTGNYSVFQVYTPYEDGAVHTGTMIMPVLYTSPSGQKEHPLHGRVNYFNNSDNGNKG